MGKIDQRHLRVMQALGDVLCWFAATLALGLARYDFNLSLMQWSSVLAYAGVAGALQLVAGWLLKLYRGRAIVGTFLEVTLLAEIVAVVSLICAFGFILFVPDFPKGVAVIVPFGALMLMLVLRLIFRSYSRSIRRRQRREGHAAKAEPVIVYGAGNAGIQLERLLAHDPDAPYEVVGFVDDDPTRANLQIGSAKVLGRGDKLVQEAERLGVSKVILAITTASPKFKTELADRLDPEGIDLLSLPNTRDIVGGRVAVNQIAKLDVGDLLGRPAVKMDLTDVANSISGKVVLVTGAGGSIGSEIARQVHRFGPAELVCLDRDEGGLHAVQLSIYGSALLDTPDMVLCDIRDQAALDKIFEAHKPDVVFHAAALKHLPLLQQYPLEGWKTNVVGTLNVLECAARHGVERFVNISTDKAADPTSILGATKRRAEELTSWFAQQGVGTYLSVRFGNVLGSRGSVLHTFADQIERGGPVTVVHPDVTRYFMTIPEACQLVLQSGVSGNPGDVMVLDMGEPVRILDVAQRLVRRSGRDIEIVFTGLRKGEKLHVVLFSEKEAPGHIDHPLISRVSVQARDPQEMMQLGPEVELRRWLDPEQEDEAAVSTDHTTPVQEDSRG